MASHSVFVIAIAASLLLLAMTNTARQSTVADHGDGLPRYARNDGLPIPQGLGMIA
jgi:hypothetical protein